MSTATTDAAPTPPALVFETAAEHLTSRVPVVSPDDRAGDVRRDLAGRRFDTVAGVAVCEGERFAGLLLSGAILLALLSPQARRPVGETWRRERQRWQGATTTSRSSGAQPVR